METTQNAKICQKDMNVNVWTVVMETQRRDAYVVTITLPFALGINVETMHYVALMKMALQSAIVLKTILMEIQALNVSFKYTFRKSNNSYY